jgi:hypothetical protein
LAGRGLALTGGQHAAHNHFLDVLRLQPGAFDGGADRNRSHLGCGQGCQIALEAAHGRAGTANNNDGVMDSH